MSAKKTLQELKAIWISNSKTRKEIVRNFSWIITWKETKEEIESNKKRIFNILMSENSSIKNFFIDNIWLSDETLLSLNDYLSKTEFIDSKTFYDNLSMFFKQKFQYLDMIVYKFNKKNNSLNFHSWNQINWSNISINNLEKWEYETEINALNSKKENFFIHNNLENQHFWWIWSIKIETKYWTYIISFNKNQFLYNKDPENYKNDILKAKKIFNKYWLSELIKLYLKNINEVYKDDLTWLYNKKYINHIPKNIKYSALFIDLNWFKSVNDNYWHDAWDKVLIWVSEILKDSVRDTDKVCRISWDEFVILIPSNNPSDIELIKNKIEQKINSKKFEFISYSSWNKEEVSVSATIWYEVSRWKNSLADIIWKADKKMYYKKSWEAQKERIIEDLKRLSKKEIIEIFESLKIK